MMRQLLPVEAKNHRWGTGATTALVAVPVLYILSIGPLAYAFEKSGRPISPQMEAALTVFYAPLRLLCRHTPIQEQLNEYIDWWADLGK
ncbi:MAG: hypothetical protein ACO1QR_13985 [Chthoniobacteraceae bacterium]